MKLTKGKIIAAALILCVLAGAFFLGGPVGGAEDGLPAQSTAGEALPAEIPDDAAPEGAEAGTSGTEEAAAAAAEEDAPAPEGNPVQAAESENTGKGETVPVSVAPEPSATDGGGAGEDGQQTKGLSCTLSVTCASILDNLDRFDPDKVGILPADGVIFPATIVSFSPGESAFDVLKREMIAAKIHFEFMETPLYNASYIEGIANIYEFDCGELSGWMYRVNGAFENYGSSLRLLEDGDAVEFVFTCDLGRDVGGFVAGD